MKVQENGEDGSIRDESNQTQSSMNDNTMPAGYSVLHNVRLLTPYVLVHPIPIAAMLQ